MSTNQTVIADKAEDNPVFQDQIRKRKRMLCAAFAAAACSTGVLFSLAKGNPERTMCAGMVTAAAGYMATPFANRRRRLADDPAFQKTCQPSAYDPEHPYQVLVTEVMKDFKGREDAKVYWWPHETALSFALSDTRDIYIDRAFEKAINSEEDVKAVVAHEAGHLQDDDRMRTFSLLNTSLAGMSGTAVPVMLALMPATLPVAVAAVAVTAGSLVATHLAMKYVERRTEHIADIRSMYNIRSKTLAQDAPLKSFRCAIQLVTEDHRMANWKRAVANEMPLPPLKLPGEDYASRFCSHPNSTERRVVMDEAAKYMPG